MDSKQAMPSPNEASNLADANLKRQKLDGATGGQQNNAAPKFPGQIAGMAQQNNKNAATSNA